MVGLRFGEEKEDATMELKEFISDVLVQIAEGVRDADEAVSQAGGVASPATRFGPRGDAPDTPHFATLANGAPVFLVDFDVPVTVSESSGADAHARLSIATVFSAGVGGKQSDSTATVSRVRFKVPIALPVNAKSAEDVQAAKQKANRPLPRSPSGGFVRGLLKARRTTAQPVASLRGARACLSNYGPPTNGHPKD